MAYLIAILCTSHEWDKVWKRLRLSLFFLAQHVCLPGGFAGPVSHVWDAGGLCIIGRGRMAGSGCVQLPRPAMLRRKVMSVRRSSAKTAREDPAPEAGKAFTFSFMTLDVSSAVVLVQPPSGGVRWENSTSMGAVLCFRSMAG